MTRAAAAILVSLGLLLVISFSGMVYFGLTSGELAKIKDIQWPQFDFSSQEAPQAPAIIINKSYSDSQATSSSTVTIAAPTPVSKAVVKPCSRATVTHLDGSTSNLCYTSADAGQLATLGNQLWTAQNDLTFRQNVYDSDKRAYELYGGDLFKTTMERDAQDLQTAKDKVGSITLQMQVIEARGW